MARSLKIAILKSADCEDRTLWAALSTIEGARITAEAGLDDLEQILSQIRPDVLMIATGQRPADDLFTRLAALSKAQGGLNVVLAGPDRDPDMLIAAMRSGVREFLQFPIEVEKLLEVLQSILKDQPVRQAGKMRVFHGTGGGCGSSTLACNVAVEMAQSVRGRVVLVDLDVHTGQLAAMLDLFPTYSLLDLCHLDPEELDPARLESALLRHDSGLYVLARPKEVAPEDREVLSRTAHILGHLIDHFDHVLVDVNWWSDVTAGSVFQTAEEVVLVAQPVVPSIHNAARAMQVMQDLGVGLDRICVVLNRVPRRSGSVKTASIEKKLGQEIFWEVPEDHETLSESNNLGIPLKDHAAGSKVRSSIRDLAAELLKSESAARKRAGKKSLFNRVFNKTNVA